MPRSWRGRHVELLRTGSRAGYAKRYGFGDHRRYWRMQVEVEEIAAPFAVSVVCDDEAPPALKEKALQRGLLLA